MKQLSFNWAVSHFPDEIQKDLCEVNGVSFEDVKRHRTALEALEIRSLNIEEIQ